jgi:hypothetical protein
MQLRGHHVTAAGCPQRPEEHQACDAGCGSSGSVARSIEQVVFMPVAGEPLLDEWVCEDERQEDGDDE